MNQVILLIEPNNILAQTYSRALAHHGFTVSHVVDAQSAVQSADRQPPALVLMELLLSEHDGIEFLHEFRSYPEWRDIPVIINTLVSPTTMLPVRPLLVEQFAVKCVLYKPKSSLGDIIKEAKSQLGFS